MTRMCLLVNQYSYRHARVQRFAEALADAGAIVDMLCLRERNCTAIGEPRGVRVITIPVSRQIRDSKGLLFEYLAAFVLFSVRLLILHAKNRYDVIQVHNMPDFLVFAAFIPRLLGAKLILDICDPMPEMYLSKTAGRGNGNLALRLIELEERLSTALADAVTCANAHFKTCLVRRGVPASKITVVNYVPDLRLFDPDLYSGEQHRASDQGDSPPFTLVYPGTLEPRYGLDLPIRALPGLIPAIPGIRLVIMGPYREHVDDLVTLAEQLGVSSFVEFKPPVPLNDVAAHLAEADVGLYAAIQDPHMSIAMPLKVLEYAAMGVPIIASRLKVLEEIFSDSAVLFFEPGDVEQFAGCVLTLYLQPERRAELARNAYDQFVACCSWRAEQQRYFELLNHLLPAGERLGAVAAKPQGKLWPEETA